MSPLLLTRKSLVLIGLVVIAVLVFITRPDKRPPLEAPVPPQVRVATVELRDLAPTETLTGRLQPARRAELRFEVPGQVQTRHVEPGQSVEAGAVLLSLDPADYQDALREATAQLELERASVARDKRLLALAEQNRQTQAREVERQVKLGERSLVSASRLDESRQRLVQLQAEEAQLRHSVATAESRVALREAARDKAQRNLDRSQLVAPFAGTVNRVEVNVGDFMSVGGMAVELVDTRELDLYAQVRGEVAAALQLQQTVEVTINGRRSTGWLIALQTDPDSTTFTHALRIRIPGDSARAGELARVELPLRALDATLTVPSTALLRQDGRSYVFLVENEQLRRVEVVAGARVESLQVIREGLEAGQLVVARDVAALSDGQTVSLSRED